MSSLSMLGVFNAFIVMLTIINYSASQPALQRYDYLQALSNKRDGIKYAIDLLSKIDDNLEEIERKLKKRSGIQNDCSVIGGLPGADCSESLGDYATMSPRNPGKKRSLLHCKLFGRNCGEQSEDSINGQNPKRKKRDDDDGPCLSDEPGTDCENDAMKKEARSQKWIKNSNRVPG